MRPRLATIVSRDRVGESPGESLRGVLPGAPSASPGATPAWPPFTSLDAALRHVSLRDLLRAKLRNTRDEAHRDRVSEREPECALAGRVRRQSAPERLAQTVVG
jgi:hypothetical protein